MKKALCVLTVVFLLSAGSSGFCETGQKEESMALTLDAAKSLPGDQEPNTGNNMVNLYTVGVEDILQIDVLKPEILSSAVTVAPDGTITFPYIGSVMVKGLSIAKVQEELQTRLGNGYMKYPVVSVSLKESHSRKFFVYGEVVKPGSYPIEEDLSVLKAISIAGGFTRFGSSSRVKVLRAKKAGLGYEVIKVNIKALMDGNVAEDIPLIQGDIVVVSEGVF